MSLDKFLSEVKGRLERFQSKEESAPFIQDGIMRPGWVRDGQRKLEFINNAPTDLSRALRVIEVLRAAMLRAQEPYLFHGTSSPVSDAEAIDAIDNELNAALVTADRLASGEGE